MEKSALIKQKMLGLLMQNARQSIGLGDEETAKLLGISGATLSAYESGKEEAGISVLESLADICGVPVSYFWADNPLPQLNKTSNAPKTMALRRKMLGILLNQARAEADLSAEAVATAIGSTPDILAQYEKGQLDIPLSQLRALAAQYDVTLDDFVSEISTNGNGKKSTAATATDLKHFPPDVQKFLENPTNVLYIKLAMKLHTLSADTLRALAEGILEITY